MSTSIKILLTMLIITICLFGISLTLNRTRIFLKKYLRNEYTKKGKFWRQLDNLNDAICVYSWAWSTATLVSLLICIIWR